MAVFHVIMHFGTVAENRLQICDVRKKGIHVRVGDKCTATDLDGLRDLLDELISEFKR